MAAAASDVVHKPLIGRIAVGPLEGVAIAAHDLARLVAKVENDRKVGQCGFADGITHFCPISKMVKSATVMPTT